MLSLLSSPVRTIVLSLLSSPVRTIYITITNYMTMYHVRYINNIGIIYVCLVLICHFLRFKSGNDQNDFSNILDLNPMKALIYFH